MGDRDSVEMYMGRTDRKVTTMSKLKCVECPYSEYDEYFKELWCTRKVKQVN